MEKTKLADLLKRVVEEFDLEYTVLADVNGNVIEIDGKGKKEEFLSLYNAAFFDALSIRALFENLRVSILPQMVSQGNRFCYLGLLDGGYAYGVFGKTDKGVREQYISSKEIDKFLHCSTGWPAEGKAEFGKLIDAVTK